MAYLSGPRPVIVTFHGVRGSTPCQSDDIARHGGNTACVSVQSPGRAAAAVRPRHGTALLRRVDALRRAVRGHVPAQPPALGPRARPAVLQAAAAQRRPPVDPRSDAVRRAPSGRGAAEHDPPAAVPDLARRVQRRRHDPLRQAAVLRRLVRRALRRRAAQRADGRLPRRARRRQRHVHQRPPAA